jgi:hypothetical protein
MFILFFGLMVQLCSSGFYSWDSTTKYAHYYTIHGGTATRNDRTAILPYLLKTK